jgi:chromosome segregation ATPase
MLTSGEIVLLVAFLTLLGGVITAWLSFRGKLAEVGSTHQSGVDEQETKFRADLWRDNADLRTRNEALMTKNEELSEKIEAVLEAYKTIKETNQKLQREYKDVLAERDEWHKEKATLQARVKELSDDVIRLTTKITRLERDIEKGVN